MHNIVSDEIKETCFDHQLGAATATLSSSEYPVVQRIKKLARQHPDQVEIVATNSGGSICAHIPWTWIKIKPPKSVTMTDQQKAELAERFKKSLAAREE